MARNGLSASDRLTSGQSGAMELQSDNRHDVILVPSSPDLPPMPALSSMPPPATTTPYASKFSMHAFSMSSSPSLPSRTVETQLPEKIPIPKFKAAASHHDYVTLDSTPDSAARIAPLTQSLPPSGATRSAYFAGGEISSSQSESCRPVGAADNASAAEKQQESTVVPRPERYETGDLVQAVSRRRDWTPPPIDTTTIPGEDSSPSVEKWSSPRGSTELTGNDALSAQATRSDVFKTLHNSYGCSEPSTAAPATTAAPLDSFFANRKTIEAVSLGATGKQNGTKNKSPTKAGPKKKPRTLTELAMAAYADPSVDEDDGVEVPDTNAPKKRGRPKRQLEVIDENGGEILPTQPSVVRPGFPTTKLRKLQSAAATAAATTADGKKVKKPRKKPAPRTKKQVVLSPESARAESMRQDFLFGTSSQLAADESPTFLRQLHAAMQESNDHRLGENSLLDLLEDASEVDLTSEGITRTKTKLWGAAWRGEDGQVTLEHVVDLEGDEAAAFPDDPHQVLAMAQRAAAEQAREGDVDLKEADGVYLTGASKKPKTVKASQAVKAAKPAKTNVTAAAKVSLTQPAEPTPSLPLKPVAGARNKILPATPTKTQAKPRSEAQGDIPSPTQSELIALMSPSRPKTGDSDISAPPAPAPAPTTTAASTRPNFDVLSTAQLSSKVSSYGYKPMKVRSAMVALLNQCWDAKNAAQASAAQVASISTTSAPASPAKAKARKAPVKAAAKTAKTVNTTKAAKAAKTVSPTRVTKAKKAPVKKATAKTSKSSKIEILDSDASDGDRLSSPEVPCSVASDASLAYDSDIGDIIADKTEVVGEVNSSDIEMDDEALAGEPTCEETRLFTLITEAVTTAPSTTNPVQPSWHEKMLMYDTIILEEFTEWVNSALGEANEVTALQAKKWCESKSVCCTWRKNTRGKERKL